VPHAAEVRGLVRLLDDGGDLRKSVYAFGERIGDRLAEPPGERQIAIGVQPLVAKNQDLLREKGLPHGREACLVQR
jgi:hypothetical protein